MQQSGSVFQQPEEVAEVSSGEARHGRRDNGLVAAEYAAVGDVDPRVGEHLLDVLGLDGIAAYLRPSTDLNPVTRSSSLPGRPTDRLYVDRTHLSAARDYVRRLAEEAEPDEPAADTVPASATTTGTATGTGSGLDLDAAWAEIVAGFDLTAEAPERIAPDRPGQSSRESSADEILPTQTVPGPTDPTGLRPAPDGTEGWEPRDRRPQDQRPSWIRLPTPSKTPSYPPASPPRPVDPEESSLLDGLDTFGAGLDDDDEGYTPPDAPPIPRPSMPSVLAVVGIVGGLIVFLQPGLVPFLSDRVAMLLGFTAVVSGFATLVWRLRPGDDDEEPDDDNGARV